MRYVGYFTILSFLANILGFGLGAQTISGNEEYVAEDYDSGVTNSSLILICGTFFLVPTFYASIVYYLWINYEDTQEKRARLPRAHLAMMIGYFICGFIGMVTQFVREDTETAEYFWYPTAEGSFLFCVNMYFYCLAQRLVIEEVPPANTFQKAN